MRVLISMTVVRADRGTNESNECCNRTILFMKREAKSNAVAVASCISSDPFSFPAASLPVCVRIRCSNQWV